MSRPREIACHYNRRRRKAKDYLLAGRQAPRRNGQNCATATVCVAQGRGRGNYGTYRPR